MLSQKHLPWAALAVALTATSCGGQSGDDPRAAFQRQQQGLPAVEAVEVMYGSFPLEERLAGSVRARNQTEIFAEASGTIEAVFVDDGDQVTAGDPLVQLRARDFEERVRQAESGLAVADARVRQAEANLTRMDASLERIEMIVDRGLGTQAELDTARADALSAQADLDLMTAQREQAASALAEQRAALADTLVRAPIDGIVGGRNAEVGQQANTSNPLFVIGDVSAMRVEVTLTQQMLGYITPGTAVNIYSDTSPDQIIQAEIARISPYLHPVTHTTNAEIVVDEHGGRLRPGMFVTVDVLHGQSEQSALVPNSAIYRHPRDGREGVWVTSLEEALRDPEGSGYASADAPSLEDPVGPVSVRFAAVDVVARGRASSGISGVEPGDWVVTIGHHLLMNSNDDQAIVQPTAWDHILDLQQMQSRDLLDVIAEKQRQNEARTFEAD
jgi:RND family efflux transporter MFP subunit